MITRSASSASATPQAAFIPCDVHLERRERAPEARDLLRREVDDRVAAGERAAQLPLARAVEHLELEARVVEERRDVGDGPVREVVDADDLEALGEQPLADVRPDEARRTGYADLGSCRRPLSPREAARGSPAAPAPLRPSRLAADDLRVDVRGRRKREARDGEHVGQVRSRRRRVCTGSVTRARWTTEARMSSSRRSKIVFACATYSRSISSAGRSWSGERDRRTSTRRRDGRRPCPDRRRASSRRRSSTEPCGR